IPATADKDSVLHDPEIETVVELMGGVDDALYVVRTALQSGKNVVTANKALLAEHGYALFDLARRNNRFLCFEAAIAGAIPIVRSIETIFCHDKIHRLTGIINGTTNYILTRMRKERLDYRDALAAAQQAGIAEADPSLDVGGHDAQQKLALLVSLVTGQWVEAKNIPVRGITEISAQEVEWAERFHNRIRLVATYRAENSQHYLSVTPALVGESHPLYDIEYENNAVVLNAEYSGEHLFMGKGAGKFPTAFSVFSDLMHLKLGQAVSVHLRGEGYLPLSDIAETMSAFYLRLRVYDQPGVLAAIAQILSNNALSIASVHQDHSAATAGEVDVVIQTHRAQQSLFTKALSEMDRLKNIVVHKVWLPVLD
ncbi:MAG: homoserine dehydrogenase, partial [Leptospiraceae bacterium]|nr:homoserine dehydrogenase [Leptospiraceae bacterium]